MASLLVEHRDCCSNTVKQAHGSWLPPGHASSLQPLAERLSGLGRVAHPGEEERPGGPKEVGQPRRSV